MNAKPCTSTNGKHTWQHVKNFAATRHSGIATIYTLRGIYTCTHCNAQRAGKATRDGGDLRQHAPTVAAALGQ